MQFSVLMSVYYKDNPKWLKQAIDSVLNNTVKPSELVIMVDGPVGNDIQSILNEASKNKIIKILSHPVNIGRGAALGYAVPRCSYDLIALMDADDVCRSYRFEKQLDIFNTNSELAVVGGQIQEVDSENFTNLTCRNVPLTHIEICKYIKTRAPFNNVTVMFKKQVILEAGNYKSFGQLEDYYMWARVIAKGYKTQNISDVLVDVRVNPQMYNRRGGYKYFQMNKLVFDEMLKLKLLSKKDYYCTLFIRFVVQVLMPNNIRTFFYKKVLR